MNQFSNSFNKFPSGFVFVLIMPIILFWSCSGNDSAPQEVLLGEWNRSDGNYTLDITETGPEGLLKVTYLNPNPINVGRSAWRIHQEVVQLYVELRDENYPGSLYTLYYDKSSEMLLGSYFQAVTKETFEVQFSKNK